jgi:hypothetical protein
LCIEQVVQFNVICGICADAFGQGIPIPIPKGDKKVHNLIEDYRGITISVVISKVFEHVICKFNIKVILLGQNEFGFKN